MLQKHGPRRMLARKACLIGELSSRTPLRVAQQPLMPIHTRVLDGFGARCRDDLGSIWTSCQVRSAERKISPRGGCLTVQQYRVHEHELHRHCQAATRVRAANFSCEICRGKMQRDRLPSLASWRIEITRCPTKWPRRSSSRAYVAA